MFKMTFEKGDIVWYRGDFGGAERVRCTITGVGTKGGQKVYDNDLGKWGYGDQYEHLFPEFAVTLYSGMQYIAKKERKNAG